MKIFPFNANEIAFLDGIHDYGRIKAELITNESALASLIGNHPILQWKCQNVIAYKMQ